MTANLQLILSKVDHCVSTMDGWTSRANDSYLAVTVHFISDVFQLKAAILSTKKLMDDKLIAILIKKQHLFKLCSPTGT